MSITLKPRQSVVTIYQGDYLDRIRDLERRVKALAEAEEEYPRLLGEKSQALQLAEEHDALVREAEESAIRVTVQALGRRQWRELVAAHPPRKDNESDKAVGVNEDTFRDALVPASIVEPEMTDEEREAFLDALADVDFERIYLTAFALNRSPAAGPKAASLASRLTPRDAETSN